MKKNRNQKILELLRLKEETRKEVNELRRLLHKIDQQIKKLI